MPTSYPGALDNFTNPVGSDPLTAPNHADQHANKNDAIEAIEAELGTDPSGTAHTTVKDRIAVQETSGRWRRSGSNQTVAHLTTTDLIYNATAWENDPYSLMSMNGTTGVLTLVAGVWEIYFGVRWAASSLGNLRQATLTLSAGTDMIQINQQPVSVQTIQVASGLVRHTAQFNVRVQVLQDTGGNLDVENSTATFIAARLVEKL